jgi:hypothetical protein
MEDLRDAAEELRKRAAAAAPDWRARYQKYRRSQLSLLWFVVVLGLPIVAVPALRGRLRQRVETLREVLSKPATGTQPLTVAVGENTEKFPEEYQQPFTPLPRFPEVIDLTRQPYRQVPDQPAAVSAASGQIAVEKPELSPDRATADAQEPQYGQGEVQRQAYELLLEVNQALAALVAGGDPGLRFRTWEAAPAEQESLLVKVTFEHVSDGTVRDYIWKVKLPSREIIPLSAYARALSKP